MGKKDKKRDLSKGEKSPALFAQPDPHSDGVDVWPLVVRDMQDRDHLGKKKYGIPLRIHNGRDALVDAYQEVLDMSVYLRQEIEEREFLRDAVEAICKIPGLEKTNMSTLGKSIKDIAKTCKDLIEQNRVLSSTVIHLKTGSAYVAGLDDGIEIAARSLESALGREVSSEEIDVIYAQAGALRNRDA